MGKLCGIGYIGKPSFALGLRNLHIGNKFGMFPGWRIEIIGGRVDIGENVRIGNNLFLNCGSAVLIGNEVTMSSNVFVGTTDHQVDPQNGTHFKQWPVEEQPVRIGSGCFIGYGAVILPGTVLGDGCVVGANAVVRGQFPSGSIIAASRAQVLRTRIKH